MNIDQWAVCSSTFGLQPDIAKITRVTDQYIYAGRRQYRKTSVHAVFDDYADAERLRDRIQGIRGEMKRRIKAAEDWAAEKLKELVP